MSETQLDPETTELDLPDEAWDEEDPPLAEDLRRGGGRSAWLAPVPLGLVAVLLLGVGFIAGVQVQKGQGDDGSAAGLARGGPGGLAAMAAMAGGQRGGAPAGGGDAAGGAAAAGGADAAAGASGSGSGTTVGAVANVKGSRLYVTTADGATVEVRVGAQADVQRLSHSSAGGVHPGDAVIVQGTSRSDGSISATAVQATAPGLSALSLFGGGRAGAGQSGGGTAPSGSGSTGRSGAGSRSGSAVDQLFEGG